MENKDKTLIAIAVGCTVLITVIGGILLYRQQKQINELRAAFDSGVSESDVEKIKNDLYEQRKGDLINNKKDIVGEIKSISSDTIVIEAQIDDINAIKTADASGPIATPIATKTYTIEKNSKTIVEGSLRVGGIVQAFSDNSIYSADSFIATKLVEKDTPAEPRAKPYSR